MAQVAQQERPFACGNKGIRWLPFKNTINMQWNEAWRWPNFNIADSLLVLGAIVLLWHAYTTKSNGTPVTIEAADSPETTVNE